jgi:lysophospholipase L1-like esterase
MRAVARWLVGSVVAGVFVALFAVSASATSAALPNSTAATGDSITRGFDANGSCVLRDCPQLSWASGTDAAVNSQFARLLVLNPNLAGHQYNIAKTGARMIDLAGQLRTAGYYKIDYVTVLMGANDLCTSSAATMTRTYDLAVQFYNALASYFYYNPDGHVFVSSIPDIYQLWSGLHTNANAIRVWKLFHICQSMLATSNSDADRQKVVDRETADNSALAYVCTTYFASCRWDNMATFNFKFPVSDVSTVDYFHPSPAGQADLAAETWLASYWGS